MMQRLAGAFSLSKWMPRLFGCFCVFFLWLSIGSGAYLHLAFAQDVSLLLLLPTAVLSFLLATVLAASFPRIPTDALFFFVSLTACVVNWLWNGPGGVSGFLLCLGILAVYLPCVIFTFDQCKPLLDRLHPDKKSVWISLALLATLSCTVVATITCLRYKAYSAPNFDFGLFCNMFGYMKDTGMPLVTCERDVLMSHFAVHISPIFYLLLPFYAIFPSPMTLQILQAVIIFSGIVPVILLCRHYGFSGKVTILFGVLYCFYPALSAGCFYDIHENLFLAPLLLWLFWAFEREKYPLMYLFAVMILMVKEDAAFYLLLFALYLLLGRRKHLHGSLLALLSVGYFIGALAILNRLGAHYAALYADATPNPAIKGPMFDHYSNLIANESDGFLGMLGGAIRNPGYWLRQLFTESSGGAGKIVYLLQLILPLGLLPFCTKKPGRWILLMPLLLNLLTNYTYQYNIGFQYHFGISAFLIYAAMGNFKELSLPPRRILALIAATACCCLYLATVAPRLTTYVSAWNTGKESYRQMDAVLDELPDDASLSVSTCFVAHVADRKTVYELYYHGAETDVDYVVIDCRGGMDERESKLYEKYLSLGYTVQTRLRDLLTVLQKPAAE